MVGLGLTRPAGRADAGLGRRGPGAAEARRTSRPSAAAAARSRSCGGRAPTLLNPHFATGTKDQDGSRIFYEPLAVLGPRRQPRRRSWPPRSPPSRTAASPRTASRSPGSCKKGVTWHDGKPFTADDCRLHLGVRRRPGHRVDHDRHLQGHQGREGRQPHRQGAPSRSPTPFWADAFVRRARHDPSQASVRGLQGRQVARGADQPQAGRHRRRTGSWTSSRATSCAAS